MSGRGDVGSCWVGRTDAGGNMVRCVVGMVLAFVLFGCSANGVEAKQLKGAAAPATTRAAKGEGNIKDVWTEPFEGVRYLHRVVEKPKWDIHVCLIDLTKP